LRLFNNLVLFVAAIALSGCTAIRNDLDRGLAYGLEAKTLTRKVDERRPADKLPAGINAFLWRASLDSVQAIPLVTADPGKGMIVTDWYSAPTNPDDRMKLMIQVLDSDLRPDTLRVSVARQLRQDGSWVNVPALASMTQAIEENILVRARDIRGR
jgi:hypothetical protein